MRPESLRWFLEGERSHVDPRDAVRDLPWPAPVRRVPGAPHTVAEVLAHVVWWQGAYLARIDGVDTPSPERPEPGWPGLPGEGPTAWDDLVRRFGEGLDRAHQARRLDPGESLPAWGGILRGEALSLLAIHNAYHVGQIVTLRHQLGAWPPPGYVGSF